MPGATLLAARVQPHPGLAHIAAGVGPLTALAVALALTALLPPTPRTLVALGAIILLGIPHGALDGELARSRLRPRFGDAWFAVFAPPYLALSALVLVAWTLAPLLVLALFLAASVWHFGAEDTDSRDPLVVIGAGGLPVALAVLAHPAATAAIFGTVAHVTMAAPPSWLTAAAWAWLAPAAVWVVRLARAGDRTAGARAAALAAAALLLPPLTSFAIYFVCVHAPAHVRSLIAAGAGVSRITGSARAARLSVPVTTLTLLLGAALWPLTPGTGAAHLLCLTIRGLSALTLPHMLFEQWLRSTASRRLGLPAGSGRHSVRSAAL